MDTLLCLARRIQSKAAMSDNRFMEQQQIKIAYPTERLAGRRMVLFSSLDDWKTPLAPCSADDGTFVFQPDTTEPYFHFKPALMEDSGQAIWSVGSDYIAPLPEDRLIFPSFESAPHGTILDRDELASKDGEAYGFRVYLPPGYEENTQKRYPVCFMHDGHNLFFPEEAFAGQTWQVQRTLELLDKMNSIEACIVVALYPNDRFKDYTEPGCARYAEFIVETLLPHLEERYRTLSGPEHRLVMGSSLGGLVSFYLAWHHSDVFGRAACLSSTFGYDNKLIQEVQSAESCPSIKVYLDSGWPGDNFAETQAMTHIMLSKGFELGRDLQYLAVPEAQHNEDAWAQRLHLPFQFLLGLSYGQDSVIDLPQAA
jgi:predicted alpha/beta superfamily hydrolase